MASIEAGKPFGLDASTVDSVDWATALKRVVHDQRSDFIYAPHLNFIYAKAGDELIKLLKDELKSGGFVPGVPLTIEVPKPFRIRVTTHLRRLGPNFSRPGSILLPRDRLLYQVLAEQAAPVVSTRIDEERSFSHRLAPTSSAGMYLPTRVCWNGLQKALRAHAAAKSANYIVKLDVANFFGSKNQHTLINLLRDSGYAKSWYSRLEALLRSYTGDRSSRGILQGMYPSDLLGNYYLAPIDRFLDDFGVPSARYVDDIYVFVDSVDAADKLLRELIPALRSYDLVLNEAKSAIMPKSALSTEEPDLEALFAAAVAEISDQIDEEDFDSDYGFQSQWTDVATTESKKGELELQATTILFDSLGQYPGHEENIERFCLPLFSKGGSDYAVDHVIDSFRKRPSMSQIYSAYLTRFIATSKVHAYLLDLLKDPSLVDWQKMWVLAAISQASSADDSAVKSALGLLKDAHRHDALRAVAAIYVGRFGDHTRRKGLFSIYAKVSPYVQAAIFFSSKDWPDVERGNAKASWSGHTPLHSLLTAGMAKG